MVRKTVFQGKVDYLQILDELGNVDKLLEPKNKPDLLKHMFEWMLLTRMFDDKCIKLQRQGRLGTYGPMLGMEAIGVGAGLALQKEDWALPTYRELSVYLIKGVPMQNIMMYWKGIDDGLKFPEGTNVFPFSITIGSHIPQAAGMAFALKKAGKKQAIVTFIGDGGTSQGDFHEGLNFASVWKAPLVQIIANNQWAISLPRSKQTMSETLAQKAIAYGIPCIQVDGNDILAVHKAVSEALDAARNGKGPQLIEAISYRMTMHTTADDPTKYQDPKEVALWKSRDPIDRFRKYLQKKKLWTKKYEEKTIAWITQEIEEAVKKMEAYKTDPKEMFKYTWSQMTKDQSEQMIEMERSMDSLSKGAKE
jgi:pyruvate dehydrogenase E1 component alpha subunit